MSACGHRNIDTSKDDASQIQSMSTQSSNVTCAEGNYLNLATLPVQSAVKQKICNQSLLTARKKKHINTSLAKENKSILLQHGSRSTEFSKIKNDLQKTKTSESRNKWNATQGTYQKERSKKEAPIPREAKQTHFRTSQHASPECQVHSPRKKLVSSPNQSSERTDKVSHKKPSLPPMLYATVANEMLSHQERESHTTSVMAESQFQYNVEVESEVILPGTPVPSIKSSPAVTPRHITLSDHHLRRLQLNMCVVDCTRPEITEIPEMAENDSKRNHEYFLTKNAAVYEDSESFVSTDTADTMQSFYKCNNWLYGAKEQSKNSASSSRSPRTIPMKPNATVTITAAYSTKEQHPLQETSPFRHEEKDSDVIVEDVETREFGDARIQQERQNSQLLNDISTADYLRIEEDSIFSTSVESVHNRMKCLCWGRICESVCSSFKVSRRRLMNHGEPTELQRNSCQKRKKADPRKTVRYQEQAELKPLHNL